MRNFTFHNNGQTKEKRVKYCVYKLILGKYELVAMTLNLSRVEALCGINLGGINLEDVIKSVGDKFFHENYLIKAEHFKYI